MIKYPKGVLSCGTGKHKYHIGYNELASVSVVEKLGSQTCEELNSKLMKCLFEVSKKYSHNYYSIPNFM